MTHAHEELEIGHEMDRALRAAATGLAQMMERYARRHQEKTRDAAARTREEWLAQRDAARQQYLPWTAEGRLEKLHPVAASHRWAAAAAWSAMDPTARMAEQDMARRIQNAHGQHPALLVNFTDPATLQPDPKPAAKLLSMNEAYGLAATHAPDWWTIPAEIKPLEQDRPPMNALETAFHDDWQYYSETQVLPERSQWEQWANHVGRGEEFTPDKWTTSAGTVDHEARDEALAQVWDEGRDQRTTTDLASHEAAMQEAGMGDLSEHLGQPEEIAQNHSWHAYLTPARFDAAQPEELANAWRDASAAALTGDVGAKRSAEKIATMMRERRGLNPESMLIGALTEQAAQNTEARRTAEDRARRSAEAARERRPQAAAASAAPSTTPSAGAAAPIRRERVIELNNMAADFYAAQLRPGSAGHKYFTERLGSEFESGPWQLGYAPSGWQNLTNHLRAHGATDEEMVAAGLAERGKFGVRDVFRDRAMMGIRDHETGETVGFLGRDLSGDARAPKVRNTGETPAFRKGDHVFGLHEAAPGARLVRVEGPFDAMAISLASDGKAAGVAPMGTAMTETQANAIVAKANGRVWVANDSDTGGQKATEEDFFKLSSKGAEVRQVEVPGSDPAAAWQDRPVLLRSALADLPEARTAADAVVDRYLAGPDATREGFAELIDRIEPYVDPIDRQILATRVDELDAARDRRQAAETTEASATAATGTSTGPALSGPDAEPEQGWSQATQAGEEREIAEDVTAQAQHAEAAAYDRRNEAQGEMSDRQAAARDASSHGFSQSTQDQVQNAPTRTSGVQAKVTRGTGVQQTHGRTLRR
ncbi:hypothetical protein GCM10028801_44550 [Nocardioides maradonensis]